MMTYIKHTPAPWYLSESFHQGETHLLYCGRIQVSGRSEIAYTMSSEHCSEPFQISNDETKANCVLIQNAPDLLESLIAADNLLSQLGHSLPQVKETLKKLEQK